jgi:hypothetical protein
MHDEILFGFTLLLAVVLGGVASGALLALLAMCRQDSAPDDDDDGMAELAEEFRKLRQSYGEDA